MNHNLRKTIFLLYVLFLGVGIAFSQDSWKQVQDFPAEGRTFATGFSFGLNGFVGLGEGDSLLNDFYSVSFIDYNWKSVSSFPGSARKGAVSFVLDGHAYVGLGQSETGYEHDFWKYDLANDTWQETASFPGTGRAYAVADTFDGYGYVLTGIDSSGYPTDVWRYNAESNVWEQMNDFGGAGRTNGYIYSINNTLYVGNGYQGAMFKNGGFKYIPENDTWEELGVFTGSLKQGTTYASANGKGCFGLGYNSRDWWEFDPEAEEWIQVEDYGDSEESNIGGACAFTVADRIHVISGYKSTGTLEGELVQDVFIFTPDMNLPSASTGLNYEQLNAKHVTVRFYGDQNFEDAEKVVVRKKENDGEWIIVDTLESGMTTYLDTTLLADSYYTFAIAAFNISGISDFVRGSSVHTYNFIETPQRFALTKNQYNDINLTWKDVSSSEDAYIIEQKTSDEANFSVIATLPKNSEAFLYENPQKEVIYQFRIITLSEALGNDTTEIKQIGFTEPGRWEATASFPGTGRSRACSFTFGGKAYMGLGTVESGDFLKDFWQFDVSTNEWSQLNDFPGVGRMGAVAFTIGEYAYVGTGNNFDSVLTDFWRYNPADDSWTQIEDFGGGKRTGAAAFSLKGNGYVGYGASDMNWMNDERDFWKYDPLSNTWTEVSGITTSGRIGANSFAIADTGYVIFGSSYNGEKQYKLYAYYPDEDKWEEKNILNSHYDYSSGGGVFVIGEKAYLSGGLGYYYNTWGEYSKDTWEYDPVKNQFLLCGDIEFYQYNQAAFALEEKGYIFAGNIIDYSGYDNYSAKAQVFYKDSLPVFPEPDINWEDDKLVVSWNDISFSENGYNIYRSYGKGAYQLLTTLPEDSVSYSDTQFSADELDTINYKVEVFWDDKATGSEAMGIRPLNPPEIISMEVVSYNEVDFTIKKTSAYAEELAIYRKDKSGRWSTVCWISYESYIDEIEDTIVEIHIQDNTLDELEWLYFSAENMLNGEYYSYYSPSLEYNGGYTLLKHPVVDTMIRSESGINLIWTLQSEYADSVSIKRKTIGDSDSSEPELLAIIPAKDTTYIDSYVTTGEDYIFYLKAFNDTTVSKEIEFNTYVYTSVESSEVESIISVYPNPVREELYVDLPQDYHNGEVTVRIYTFSGILVEQETQYNTSIIRLPFSHLSSGIYIAEINVKGKKQFKKIIKE